VAAVAGADLDPVALATSRLTLDLFAARLGHRPQEWNLLAADATSTALPAPVLIGNFPFGYRSHEGREDISSVILRRWLGDQNETESLAVLLPESFAYGRGGTAKARAELRERFRIEELLELPEEVFERTSAATLGVIANRGEGGTPVVRGVRRRDLNSFRITGVPSETFVTQLPPAFSDPWPLTPFFNVIQRAESRAPKTLGEMAEVHFGYQAYGTAARFDSAHEAGVPVLEEPSTFMRFTLGADVELRRLTSSPQALRRTGPVDLYQEPKLILRTTTDRHHGARLASLPDREGLWFSDKFVGLWPKNEAPPLLGLAAFLQTAFCELWFATNNPSRKVRVETLRRLPVPALPEDWWARASRLAAFERTVTNPRSQPPPLTLLEHGTDDAGEWRWFEHVVAVAFGMSTSQLTGLEHYLAKRFNGAA